MCCFKNLWQILSEIEISIKYYRMWKIHFKPLKCYCFIRVSTFLNQDGWNQLSPPFAICFKIWVTGRSKWDEDIIYECLQTVIYRKVVVENKCKTREIAIILAQWTLQLWPFKDASKDFKAARQLLHTNVHYLSQKSNNQLIYMLGFLFSLVALFLFFFFLIQLVFLKTQSAIILTKYVFLFCWKIRST